MRLLGIWLAGEVHQDLLQNALARTNLGQMLIEEKASAHNGLGWALQDDGQPAEAAEHYRTAVRLQPDFAAARLSEYVSLGLEFLREARKTVSAEEWSQLVPEFLVNSDLAPLREDARWQELSKP